MRKLLIAGGVVVVIVSAVLFLPLQSMAQPKIIIDAPVFTFKPVPEGVLIPHEFIIKNSGDTLLTITNVRPP